MTKLSSGAKNLLRKPAFRALINLGKSGFRFIAEPLEAVSDSHERNRRRFLAFSTFIYSVNITAGVLFAPADIKHLMLIAVPFVILSYLLSRTRYFAWGAGIAFIGTVLLVIHVILEFDLSKPDVIIPFGYLTILIILSVFWMRFSIALLTSVIEVILSLIIIMQLQGIHHMVYSAWVPINLMVIIFVLMFKWSQDRYEEDLIQYRDKLEHMVEDRNRELLEVNHSLDSKILELEQNSQQLQEALLEKNDLLKELYHRTKNNMQSISSLLDLQMRQIKNPDLAQAFIVTQDRIRSMALVHTKLYQSKSLDAVDLRDYLFDLSRELLYSYSNDPERISLVFNCEAIQIRLNQAIPVGLILNELLTNALKYAFPSTSAGEISIDVISAPDGELTLRVKDNGQGFPAGKDPFSGDSLGYKLIKNITEAQLLGSLEMESGIDGTEITVQFRLA